MACIRSIKPDFWTDEKIVELSMTARLLFIGLWNFTDHEGRMGFSVKRIKMLVFPAEYNLDIPPLLAELQRENLIEVYAVDDKQYLQVNNFKKHQKIDARYATSKLPSPDSAVSRRIPPVEWSGVEWNGVDINMCGKPHDEPILDQKSSNLKKVIEDLPTQEHPPIVQNKIDEVGDAPPPEKPNKSEAVEVLEFLNLKSGRNYRPVPANLDMIKARLKEYSKDDLKMVIARKCREWGNDDKMEKFIRPKTLFSRTNMANYTGELEHGT